MTAFITRSGSQLLLNGQHFRFTGANIYWLGLSDVALTSGGLTIPTSVNGLYYPSRWVIGDALGTAREMGMTVVRSHTLGMSVGDPLAVCPTLSALTNNKPNTTAFNTIDYAIYLAGQLGIKLIIPFTDNYYYSNMGKRTFTNWRGLTSGAQGTDWRIEEQVFFTDGKVLNDFLHYISLVLNRVNQFNGLAYKNDPTIMAWETGNEITPPTTWTTTIANYIKSLDSNHLVVDGSYENNTDPANPTFTAAQLSIANIDIVSNHFYPTYNQIAANDAAQAAGISPAFPNANPPKVYLVGEYDWTYNPVASATAAIDTATAPGGYTQSVKLQVIRATTAAYRVQLLAALNAGPNTAQATLTKGVAYVLSFYARATGSVSNRIMAAAVQMTLAPYSPYGAVNAVLTSAWKQFSVTFTAFQTDSAAAIVFNVGDIVDTTWITGIALVRQGQTTNLVRNGSFVTNTNFTSQPWVLHLPPLVASSDLTDFLHNEVEINPLISGACLWSLMPHFDTYGFCLQTDGFAMYYPNGLIAGRNQTVDQAERMQIIRAHGSRLQGKASIPLAAGMSAPTITVKPGTPNTITWTGIIGARAYSLERAAITTPATYPFPFDALRWTVVGSYTDFQTPVKDYAAANTVYRLRAQNVDGVYGPYSLVQPNTIAHTTHIVPLNTIMEQQ